MTAEAIAQVVADIKAGNVVDLLAQGTVEGRAIYIDDKRDEQGSPEDFQRFLTLADWCTREVVDCTRIYESLVAQDKPIYVYEDHPQLAPPWPEATFAYVNEHGNVMLMSCFTVEYPDAEERGQVWAEPSQPVEWERVRWLSYVYVWLGGKNADGKPFPTAGPAHQWILAIYDNGSPADFRWLQLMPDYDMQKWDMAFLVLLEALTFLNCKNVEAVEPVRSRGERRRLARAAAVTIKTLVVYPTGRKGARQNAPISAGVPLHSVRGHFAHYGACCPNHPPRGLLFGKLSGKYFIPGHARGRADQGVVVKDFELRP